MDCHSSHFWGCFANFWHGSCIYRSENKAGPRLCFILKQNNVQNRLKF